MLEESGGTCGEMVEDPEGRVVRWWKSQEGCMVRWWKSQEGPTVRCWKSQARMTFVAIFGKIPRFFCRFDDDPFVSESSSIKPSPEPMLLSRPSPATQQTTPGQVRFDGNNNICLLIKTDIYAVNEDITPLGRTDNNEDIIRIYRRKMAEPDE